MAHDEDDHLGRKLQKGSDHREGNVTKRRGLVLVGALMWPCGYKPLCEGSKQRVGLKAVQPNCAVTSTSAVTMPQKSHIRYVAITEKKRKIETLGPYLLVPQPSTTQPLPVSVIDYDKVVAVATGSRGFKLSSMVTR